MAQRCGSPAAEIMDSGPASCFADELDVAQGEDAMRSFLVTAVALTLAGCASPGALPIGGEVVRPAAYTAPTLPPARSDTVLAVRTFVTEAGATREVPAECSFESAYSSGSFRAPARLALPELGPETPVLRVTCSDGARRGTAAARATLRRTNAFGGWPAVGISVGTGGHRGRRGNIGVGLGGWWGGGGGWDNAGALRAEYPDLRIMLQ